MHPKLWRIDMVKHLTIVAAVAGLSAPALALSPQFATDSSQYSIGISGTVPVICQARVDANMVTPAFGEVRVGSLREFCNNPNGYEVYADFSPSLAKAKLRVDGKTVNLSASGTVRVSKSNTAAIESREILLELPKGIQNGSVSFRIVAL
jgi:hypothetical protein